MNIQDVSIIANGRWESTLNSLGVTLPKNRKHGACPCCGGNDRFRFDDKEGRGTYYCNQCGAGDGFSLVSKALNLSVKDAAKVVSGIVGGNKPLPVKKVIQPNHIEAARKAEYILRKSKLATDHPYLSKKGIKAHGGVGVSAKGDLVIPVLSGKPDHVVSSLQFISPDGSKRMLTGGKIKGCFNRIGDFNQSRILLCEGYATACSLYESTGIPVFYTFNANNLFLVAKLLVEYYQIKPIVCADNDAHLDINIGVTKAIEVAKAFDLKAVAPDSQGDFNDLMLAKGKQAVLDVVNEVIL